MVYQLVVLAVIPIILTIVTYSPFDELAEETFEIEPISQEDDSHIVFLILMAIWFLFLIRVLYKVKKGTFKIRTKY